MNKREKGKLYEEQAASYLERQGFVLLDKNFACRQGEVDLIGIHENCLVFVEVKYRRDGGCGQPEEAVGGAKQARICRASDYYRLTHQRESLMQVRYDVVAVCGDQVRWHRNAFPYGVGGRTYSW